MATYPELHSLANDPALTDRIAVAVAVKAHAIAQLATPTAAQVAWAKLALLDPRGQAGAVIHYVLAEHKALSAAQITGAADSAVQTAVDGAIDNLLSV